MYCIPKMYCFLYNKRALGTTEKINIGLVTISQVTKLVLLRQ